MSNQVNIILSVVSKDLTELLLNVSLCSPACLKLCLPAIWCWVGSIQMVFRAFTQEGVSFCCWKWD